MKTIKRMRTAHQLACRNVPRTKKYFVDRLGFTCVTDQTEMVILAKDGLELHFWRVETLATPEHCSCVVDNIRDLFLEYKRQKVKFNSELAQQPYGYLEMQIVDPDGNHIRFVEDRRASRRVTSDAY